MSLKVPENKSKEQVKKCQLCSFDRNARWHCTNCDNKMCLQCKTTHLQNKEHRQHKVKNVGCSMQEPKITIQCQVHGKEQVSQYCCTCEEPICQLRCKEHNNHILVPIKGVLEKFKAELTETTQDMSLYVTSLQECYDLVKENEKSYSTHVSSAVDQINKKRHEWKHEIDKMADSIITKLNQLENKDIQIFRKQELQIQKQIAEMKVLLQDCEDKMQHQSYEVSFLKFVSSMKQHYKQEAYPTYTKINPPAFIASNLMRIPVDLGYIQEEEFETITTNKSDTSLLSTIDSSVTANFKTKDGTCISYVNDKTVWCGHGFGSGGNNVALFDIEGRVLKTVALDFELYGMTVSKDGKLLLTEWHGHHIKKYSEDGRFVNIIDTSSYKTYGMCTTADNEILVCLVRDKKQNKILRLTTDGKIKQTIQQGKGQKALFSTPRLVAENVNRDICIVDGHNSVMVVDKDGQPRFCYPDSTFDVVYPIHRCNGIACDKNGYILISDCYNHQIHQVDRDGQFINYVLTDLHGIEYPWAINTDQSGQLWVCNNNGSQITVYKYRS